MKIRLTLKIKDEHCPPDMGGGNGIIAIQVATIDIDAVDFFKNPTSNSRVFHSINQLSEQLIADFIEVTSEIIKDGQN